MTDEGPSEPTEQLNEVSLGLLAVSIADYSSIVSMLLGGCCANVWTYELLLMINPRIGSALTFCQMLFITSQSLPGFIILKPWPTLKPRQVPIKQWALQVTLLASGSLLNNWAYAFKVPLSILIVFRSAGLAVSMLLGFTVLKRRYSFLQVVSVFFITGGVILATLSRPSRTLDSELVDIQTYSIGIVMIVSSLLFSGLLGLLQEHTYQKYGPCWREGIFYTHALSLPIFLFLIPDIKQGLASLDDSWIVMGANILTQLICVSGVNRLTSTVSSVSTNVVLTARKAVSLCFSVWWFGTGWNMQLAVGAGMVFLGSLTFSVGGPRTVGKKKAE